MKRIIITSVAAAAIMTAAATDYTALNGLCGADLKAAVKKLGEQGISVVSYGDKTWAAFETTDIRMIDGRQAWFDMYSNRLVFVSSGHEGMNIEHSVANSWWGGEKNNAYKDLYHLNPSDADANNRKSHHPLGVIEGTPTWTNGLTRIGAPTPATGGGSATVFEPADEYKGDFARAYFYIFTIYDDIAWEEKYNYMYDLSQFPTLKPWATEMLLQWAAADPVDQREIDRAHAVAGIQNNVNPYVEIPELAEYVWGAKNTTPFAYTEPTYAPNRPDAPTFGNGYSLAGVNTWTGRWWETFALDINAAGGEIYYALGDDDYFQPYEGPIAIPAAGTSGQTYTVRAYTQSRYDGKPYISSTASLILTAREPGGIDYMNAQWEKVTSDADINDQNVYIITYQNADASQVMSCSAKATASSGYIENAGPVFT
ncbi:MAG: endonuclease, partial [Muribaculaceae bacterium]|nr:endonuclease [Muribaculaceae bacterium]